MADNHGNTIAAWTAVTIATLGFVVGGIGLMAYSWITFWIGVALLPIGAVAGIVLAKAGYGAPKNALKSRQPAGH
ncbi:hypothetical protein GCM10011519_01950 [Marmoricola endophyticus]|uniref:Uncharacterized protein n=1 Tax=Marmoricola endophyticus TaxID=2040280 RepID=A0A917EXU7_9ACTN|nr:HGxxPAAW family protein [Marmoricola endophyticus]GGF32148.1 hypothetical protein GCM10011519_01950 [Marmoricola endophyticus]